VSGQVGVGFERCAQVAGRDAAAGGEVVQVERLGGDLGDDAAGAQDPQVVAGVVHESAQADAVIGPRMAAGVDDVFGHAAEHLPGGGRVGGVGAGEVGGAEVDVEGRAGGGVDRGDGGAGAAGAGGGSGGEAREPRSIQSEPSVAVKRARMSVMTSWRAARSVSNAGVVAWAAR
jgi:hypothetical protein